MTNMTKKEVFGIELKTYLKATRKQKTEILDTLERQTLMNRKAIIRRLRVEQLGVNGDKKKRGRKTYYTPDVISALKDIWEASGEVCGELLHPIINEYINIFIKDDAWSYSDETTFKLRAISEGTVKDKVGKFMKNKTGKGKSTTSPSSIKSRIPVFCGPWSDVPVGHGQIDTVVHCGSTLAGNMVFSVSYTDVRSGWWEGKAQLNKGMESTKNNLSLIKQELIIPWFHAHPDCGTEFLNRFVIDWTIENNMKFTRSRSYHKNDNAYVEQKNGNIIRKEIGYQRLDTIEVIETMNELYKVISLHRNYFVPQRKLISKERHGARYKRMHDKAKTPFERVLADPSVSKRVKDNLLEIRDTINPRMLREQIIILKAKLFKIQKIYGSEVR
jgi:hypothetical protein